MRPSHYLQNCPKCNRGGFSWESRTRSWVCLYPECSHVVDPRDLEAERRNRRGRYKPPVLKDIGRSEYVGAFTER